jgi:signal transduction histidine kinase
VFYVDSDYRVLWANAKALAICPGIVGTDLRETKSDFLAEEILLLERTVATGVTQVAESCYLDDPGRNRICWEHLAVPLISESGKPDIIRISSDVSARRRAESELIRLNGDLERRIEEELRRRRDNERIAEQQSRLAAIGELATGMAHEITQPLNAISFSFENLRARLESGTSDPGYLKTKCSAVARDIERIRRVIDHVRLFARSSPEEYRTRLEPGACLENALSLTGTQMASREIDTTISIEPDLPSLYGNPYKYEQVILNLLSNARAAIEERVLRDRAEGSGDYVPGRLEINLRKSRNEIELLITDNGIGIPEEHRQRVFDPFFTTKPGDRGTGLGLSISFGIVRDMGGTIELRPAVPGPGTVAKVSIPVPGIQERSEHE